MLDAKRAQQREIHKPGNLSLHKGAAWMVPSHTISEKDSSPHRPLRKGRSQKTAAVGLSVGAIMGALELADKQKNGHF